MGFTAKTIERQIILRGDNRRLTRKVQQINHRALLFAETLEDATDTDLNGQKEDHLTDHHLNHLMAHLTDHHLNHLMAHLTDTPMVHIKDGLLVVVVKI